MAARHLLTPPHHFARARVMYDSPAGHAVRARLQNVVAHRGIRLESERDELRQAICDAVDELKGQGWSIEKIIVRLKVVADEVGLNSRFDTAKPDRESIIAQIVTWCIDRYYSDAPRPPHPAE